MIAEFALTPALFDETVHPDLGDWRMGLNTLKHRMFPQRNLCPVMLADLGGLWETYAKLAVGRITDHRAKADAQLLLTQMAGRLIHRRLQPGPSDPANEAWWARSACAASVVESIERVVTSGGCRDALAGAHPTIRALEDVEDEAFWEIAKVEWSPAATLAAQIPTLRKLCVHGEFIWLATPYITGTVDDETPFATAFVREVFRRPAGFLPPVEVEIHSQALRNAPVKNHVDSVRQSLRPVLPPGQTVRLVLWDKFEERIVLAGGLTRTSTGRGYAPRWGVHMGHIARRNDAGRGLRHEWKQLNDESVGHWYRTFSTRNQPRLVVSEVIRP